MNGFFLPRVVTNCVEVSAVFKLHIFAASRIAAAASVPTSPFPHLWGGVLLREIIPRRHGPTNRYLTRQVFFLLFCRENPYALKHLARYFPFFQSSPTQLICFQACHFLPICCHVPLGDALTFGIASLSVRRLSRSPPPPSFLFSWHLPPLQTRAYPLPIRRAIVPLSFPHFLSFLFKRCNSSS